VPGAVESLAMDGARVAFDVEGDLPKGRCNRVRVWNVLNGAMATASGKGTCAADNSSTGAGVRQLAIAGTRLAWIVNVGGNSESDDYLYTASLPRPKEKSLAFARRVGIVGGDLAGDWIGGLAGNGRVLAVNQWRTGPKNIVTEGRLRTIGTGLHTIANGTDTIVARSTDGTKIAVLRPDGSVGLYSSSGSFLRQVTPSSAKEVALGGGYLVVLTKGASVEIYDAGTGVKIRSTRVARGAGSIDLEGSLLAYRAFRAVHVLRLKTLQDLIVARAGKSVAGVQLEPPGLAYAWTTATGVGKLAFVPKSRLR